jgi:hypothetical protein
VWIFTYQEQKVKGDLAKTRVHPVHRLDFWRFTDKNGIEALNMEKLPAKKDYPLVN